MGLMRCSLWLLIFCELNFFSDALKVARNPRPILHLVKICRFSMGRLSSFTRGAIGKQRFGFRVHGQSCSWLINRKDKFRNDDVVYTLERLGQESHFHISSPAHGWEAKNLRTHADYVDANDFREVWKKLPVTIDVEAWAKELAVMKLMQDLGCAR